MSSPVMSLNHTFMYIKLLLYCYYNCAILFYMYHVFLQLFKLLSTMWLFRADSKYWTYFVSTEQTKVLQFWRRLNFSRDNADLNILKDKWLTYRNMLTKHIIFCLQKQFICAAIGKNRSMDALSLKSQLRL